MQRWRPDPTVLGGMRACGEMDGGAFVEWHFVKQAIAEKDREIQQIREHEFQRGYQEAEEKYQQLMEKAVKFAEAFEIVANDNGRTCIEVQQFLNSPEVQAWKEQKP